MEKYSANAMSQQPALDFFLRLLQGYGLEAFNEKLKLKMAP